MSKTAIVTGATGFIGSALVTAFSRAGWNVVALCRRPEMRTPIEGVVYRRYELGDALEYGGEALVHCAYEPDGKAGAGESINVTGSARLIESARARGVRKIVFLSSMASGMDAGSRYGREKFSIERMLDHTSDLIVRPGLVIGDGGLFRAMTQTIRKTHLAPVFHGGRQPVYTVAIRDLCAALVRLVEAEASGTYTLASAEPVEMKTLLTRVGRRYNVPVHLIPLPYTATLWLTAVADAIGLKLPISSESVRGIRNLRRIEVPSYRDLGIVPRSFDDALQEMFSS